MPTLLLEAFNLLLGWDFQKGRIRYLQNRAKPQTSILYKSGTLGFHAI